MQSFLITVFFQFKNCHSVLYLQFLYQILSFTCLNIVKHNFLKVHNSLSGFSVSLYLLSILSLHFFIPLSCSMLFPPLVECCALYMKNYRDNVRPRIRFSFFRDDLHLLLADGPCTSNPGLPQSIQALKSLEARLKYQGGLISFQIQLFRVPARALRIYQNVCLQPGWVLNSSFLITKPQESFENSGT